MAGPRKNYDEAARLYAQGLSIQDIASMYAVTRQAMHSVLRRRGVRFRSRLRYGKLNHFHRGTKASDRAQNLAETAVQKGIILRGAACETCGRSGTMKDGRSTIQAHHDDYNKPLAVRWLCQKCHHAWHKTNKAVPERR